MNTPIVKPPTREDLRVQVRWLETENERLRVELAAERERCAALENIECLAEDRDEFEALIEKLMALRRKATIRRGE